MGPTWRFPGIPPTISVLLRSSQSEDHQVSVPRAGSFAIAPEPDQISDQEVVIKLKDHLGRLSTASEEYARCLRVW
eukprot:12890420-Prorocentrum_lima.AAC.1